MELTIWWLMSMRAPLSSPAPGESVKAGTTTSSPCPIIFLSWLRTCIELSGSARPGRSKGSVPRDLLQFVVLFISQPPAPPKALCTTLFSRSRSAASGRGHVATVAQLAPRRQRPARTLVVMTLNFCAQSETGYLRRRRAFEAWCSHGRWPVRCEEQAEGMR